MRIVRDVTSFSVCGHASKVGSLLHTAMRIPLLTQSLCIYNYKALFVGRMRTSDVENDVLI
jgi:hypothetical protein